MAAEKLFTEGREAFSAGDYETACAKFGQSDALDPAAGTKFNWAFCEEKRGDLAKAWELFQVSARAMEADDARKPHAEKRAETLAARLAQVTFVLAAGSPAETTATLGDLTVDARTFGVELPTNPGTYAVVVNAPGRPANTIEITLGEGETRTISLVVAAALLPEPAPEPAPIAPVAPAPIDPPPHDAGSSLVTTGWVIGGVGAAGLVVGAITGGLTLDKKSISGANCDDVARTCNQLGSDANDAGRTLGTVTTVSWVIGAAALTTGVVMIVMSDDGHDVAVLPTPGGLQGRVRW